MTKKMECELCGGSIDNGSVIRLRNGFAKILPNGEFVFQQERFEDQSVTKWVHIRCAHDTSFAVPMEDDNGVCHLCANQFEPEESPWSESVVYAEVGVLGGASRKANPFVGSRGTMVHFTCACDNWELRLWGDLDEI